MAIDLVGLESVAPEAIVALHADPQVRRHLPLATDDFDLAACREWIIHKRALWDRHGYGPWAILVDGAFAGWGGLQPEGGEPDLALVLSPRHWGQGPAIVRHMLHWAFECRRLPAVTALLPLSRVRQGGMQRLGFEACGQYQLGAARFVRYRLRAADCPGITAPCGEPLR
ncbi:MAG: GNAT family N-acetyltransferase [Rhodocyclaceae bacterium]|nr:GNAT family N-acetyltransferase [Rhodocyclaceae bacterium]